MALVALVATGCGADGERFPPPSPAITSGAGGGSGGSGGDGGDGGAGGATTTGTLVPPNVCECAYSAIVSVECGNCVNAAAFNECVAEGQACDGDTGCETIAGCPAKCNNLSADQKPACAQACVLDSKDSSSFHLYLALMDCVCASCAQHCKPAEPLACE